MLEKSISDYLSEYLLILKWLVLWVVWVFSDPMAIREPLDVSVAGQESVAEFTVKDKKYHRFSIYFSLENDAETNKRQEKIVGNHRDPGFPLDIELAIQRNTEKAYKQQLHITGVNGLQMISYNGKSFRATERLIADLELIPGDYKVKIIVLKNNKKFRKIEAYASFASFN